MDDNVAKLMLEWFRVHGKCYPFRYTNDPYKIFVSEIMLRQTNVRQVSQVYPIFITKYPTLERLSEAPIEDVEKYFLALGIAKRAEYLVNGAKYFIEMHEGKVPSSYEDLIVVKGIGDYTANCILTLCYNMNQPMVDANIKRVLSRLYSIDRNDAKEIKIIYKRLAPKDNQRDFFYAIIDLAHEICKFKTPLCDKCPISNKCLYNKNL